jgi:ribonuclease HI
VRGHAGHAQNEYANDLAVRAAGAQSSSDGLVESGFDAWLAEKAANKRPVTLEPFPDPAVFRASRTLPATESASP